jgi:hypothetical protein
VDQADLLTSLNGTVVGDGSVVGNAAVNDILGTTTGALDLTHTALNSIEILGVVSTVATTFTVDVADLLSGGSVVGNSALNDTLATNSGALNLTSTTLTSIEILDAGTATVATTFTVNQADLLGVASANGSVVGNAGVSDVLTTTGVALDLSGTTLTSVEVLAVTNAAGGTFTVDQADLAANGSVTGAAGTDILGTTTGVLDLTSTTLTSVEILGVVSTVATTFTVDAADLVNSGTVAGNAALNDTLATNSGTLDLTSTTLTSVEILDAGTAPGPTTFTVDAADLQGVVSANGSVVGNVGGVDVLATNSGALDLTHTSLTSIEVLDAGTAAGATTFTVNQTDLVSGGSVIGNGGGPAIDVLLTTGGALDLTSTTLTSVEILSGVGATVPTTFTVDQADLLATGTVIGNAGQIDTVQLAAASLDLSNTTLSSIELVRGTAINNTITGGASALVVNGGLGTDSIVLGLANLVTDTVIFDQAFVAGSASADTLLNFNLGVAGPTTDVIDVQFAMFNGATSVPVSNSLATVAPVTLADAATADANGVIYTLLGNGAGVGDRLMATSSVGTAVLNAVAALTSGTDFSSANINLGDSMLLQMNDGVTTFLFHYVPANDAFVNVTTVADLELIGVITGTTAALTIGNII